MPAIKHAKPESHEGEWIYPENPSDFGFWKERCYIRVQNIREIEAPVSLEEAKPIDKRAQNLKDAEKAKMQSIEN